MTVSAKLLAQKDQMTPSERQLLGVLMDDYPMAGLESITDLATRASVSTATVARMLQKAGLGGYPQFQTALRCELKEMISDPVSKRQDWDSGLPEEHILNRFARHALTNQQRSLEEVDPRDFDALCTMLSDPDRKVFLTGGRISSALAQYFYLHLQMIRPNVRLVPNAGAWPHDLLDMAEGDIVLAMDVRRYENTTLQLAQMSHEAGAQIVLFTDQWRSPIHRIARLTFCGRIAVPSAWDSLLPLMLLAECTIAALQEDLWESVQTRTDALEQAFDRTKLFRKFQ